MFVHCGSMSQRQLFILAILVQFVALGHMWTSQCNTTCTEKTACRCGTRRTPPLSEPPHISTIRPPVRVCSGNTWSSEYGVSVVLWHRGVPVGVVYAGTNAMFRSEVFPQRTRTGGWTVLIRGGSDDGGVRLAPHLQAVFPVLQRLWWLS